MDMFNVVDQFINGTITSNDLARRFVQNCQHLIDINEYVAVHEIMNIINQTKNEADKICDYTYDHNHQDQYGSTYSMEYKGSDGRILTFNHHYSYVINWAYVQLGIRKTGPVKAYLTVGYQNSSVYIEYNGNKFSLELSQNAMDMWANWIHGYCPARDEYERGIAADKAELGL